MRYPAAIRLSLLLLFGLVQVADCRADVIIDNDGGPPSYAEAGGWSPSAYTGFRNGGYSVSSSQGASATWRPGFSTARHCEVVVVFRSGGNRADDARYTVAHAGGTTVVQLSQYAATSSMVEASLGEFDFGPGADQYVRLEAVAQGKIYIADAVLFRTGTDDPPAIFPASVLPVRPAPSSPVPLTAVITDDDAVASATVLYTPTPPGIPVSVPAYDDGAHADGAANDGRYGAAVPGQPDGTSVTCTLVARDTAGQETSRTVGTYLVSSAPFPEYRAMWVTSWGSGFLNPAQADTLVSTLRAANLNTILPEVRKTGDAYYDSAFEPRGSNIPGATFDPLAYLIQAAHDTSGGKGRMQVHAWFVMHRAWVNGSGALPTGHVLARHPEYEMVRQDGSVSADDRWLDPGHPGAVDHNVAVVLDCLSKYDLDGIHFDYIRYPGNKDWGYNARSVERFNTVHGRSGVPATTDSLWCDWRRECVSLEVKKITVKARMLRPQAVVTAATICGGSYNTFQGSTTYSDFFQDWGGWLRNGIIDYNMIMNYVADTNPVRFQGWTDLSLAEDEGRGSVIGLAPYMSNSIQGTLDQVRYCRMQGADGTNLFSWGGEVTSNSLGETKAQFYAALKDQLYTTRVDPPGAPWKSAPTAGIYEGVVRLNGQPVDHAAVRIDGRPETATVTDGSGWYAILDAPVGAATLRFSKPGLPDVVLPASIPAAGNIITVDANFTGNAGICDWNNSR